MNPFYRDGGRGERLLAFAEARARESGFKSLFVLSTRTTHWFIERGFGEADISRLPGAQAVALQLRTALEGLHEGDSEWHAWSTASSSSRRPRASISRPYPGELGKRLWESVSKEAWKEWLEQQKMLVNENRLNLADPRARKYLEEQMRRALLRRGRRRRAGLRAEAVNSRRR